MRRRVAAARCFRDVSLLGPEESVELSDAQVLIADDNPQAWTLLANMLGQVIASVRHDLRPRAVAVDATAPGSSSCLN